MFEFSGIHFAFFCGRLGRPTTLSHPTVILYVRYEKKIIVSEPWSKQSYAAEGFSGGRPGANSPMGRAPRVRARAHAVPAGSEVSPPMEFVLELRAHRPNLSLKCTGLSRASPTPCAARVTVTSTRRFARPPARAPSMRNRSKEVTKIFSYESNLFIKYNASLFN